MRFLKQGIGLTLIIGSLAAPLTAAAEPLFRLNGLDYNEEDLPLNIQQALHESRAEHHKKMMELINGAALETFIQEKAKALGQSREALATKELSAEPPSDEEMKAFYEANKVRMNLQRYSYNQIKPQIARLLQSQAVQDKAFKYVQRLQDEGVYEPLLKEPQAPYAEIDIKDYPSKGGANAKVTVVEYADYRCPHCRDAGIALKPVLEKYGDKVRFVFKDMPVDRTGVSRIVAQGAHCASEQGKFWEYHEAAFAQQDSLTTVSATKIAKDLGLEGGPFGECMASSRPEQKVAASQAEGERIGVEGTPTFFINGRRQIISDVAKDLQSGIEKALASAKK